MKLDDFDYPLPKHLIAQTPMEPRDHSRLMVLHRAEGRVEHHHFYDLPRFLRPGDVLVFNDTRVLTARLLGFRQGSGGKVELLLLRHLQGATWQALAKPSRRVRPGDTIAFLREAATVEVLAAQPGGLRTVAFSDASLPERLGQTPLPPYLRLPLSDPERYQTVYARVKGSAAAPTAGLHFTHELLQRIGDLGVQMCFVTLHIGLDTFRPVSAEDPRMHKLHREYGELSQDVADHLNKAKVEGRRVICVGTTTVRLLETAAAHAQGDGEVAAFAGWTGLFILPGHGFRAVDAMITNFHLPRTTLLMLVSAFAGREFLLQAYAEAVQQSYRFYSFGDAMLIG